MVKIIDKDSVPADDPMFSGGQELFSVRMPVDHATRREPTLYYREGRLGLVFAAPEAAQRVDQINRALKAETWGELTRLMPEEELPGIFAQLDWDDDGKPVVPDDDEPVPTDFIAGVSEGDYPPWLTAQHHALLPSNVIREFGKRYDTVLNGSVWIFDPSDEVALLVSLAERGIRAVRRDDLTFE